jgi:uncharacterized protein YqjF (DUF2071 family)
MITTEASTLSTVSPPFISQLSARVRPDTPVFASQRWNSVLFLHWPLPPRALRPHVPKRLALDTFEGEAWVTATLGTVTGARVRPLPVLGGLASFHQVALRTYVRLGDKPGVWFFTLDSTNFLANALARLSLRLPSFLCRASRRQVEDEHHYEALRLATRKAEISACWRWRGAAVEPASGSLESFLVQRFCSYSPSAAGRLWREPLHHAPWPLLEVELLSLKHTLDVAHELPQFPARTLAHYSPGVDVEFFAPQLV